jgi:hypothetical protein
MPVKIERLLVSDVQKRARNVEKYPSDCQKGEKKHSQFQFSRSVCKTCTLNASQHILVLILLISAFYPHSYAQMNLVQRD